MPDAARIESAHATHKIFLEGFWTNSARIEKELGEWERLARMMKKDA